MKKKPSADAHGRTSKPRGEICLVIISASGDSARSFTVAPAAYESLKKGDFALITSPGDCVFDKESLERVYEHPHSTNTATGGDKAEADEAPSAAGGPAPSPPGPMADEARVRQARPAVSPMAAVSAVFSGEDDDSAPNNEAAAAPEGIDPTLAKFVAYLAERDAKRAAASEARLNKILEQQVLIIDQITKLWDAVRNRAPTGESGATTSDAQSPPAGSTSAISDLLGKAQQLLLYSGNHALRETLKSMKK